MVKLHRCGGIGRFIRGPHPCWVVQKALDDQGVEYEVAPEPLRRGKREETLRKTGQRLLPWVELEDGTAVREESKALAARIRAGNLRPGA